MSEAGENTPNGPRAESQPDLSASAVGRKSADPSLGAFLTAARERRGLTRDAAVKETRIPAHYIAMIESNNYAAIADQLYLLPFIRRYAQFLGLDAEEIAIRFVREVQRAESNVVRISEPIVERRRRGQNPSWIWVATAVVVAILIAAFYFRGRGRLLLGSDSAATTEPSSGALDEKSSRPALAAPAKPQMPASSAAGASSPGAPLPPQPPGNHKGAPATEAE
jgi:cytoskeleton protein RodZ